MKYRKKLIQTDKHETTARCNLSVLINILRLQSPHGKPLCRFFSAVHWVVSLIARTLITNFLIMIKLIHLRKIKKKNYRRDLTIFIKINVAMDFSIWTYSPANRCNVTCENFLLFLLFMYSFAIGDKRSEGKISGIDIQRKGTWKGIVNEKENPFVQRETVVLGQKGSPPEIRSDLSDELLPMHLTEDELTQVASIRILFAANIALKFRVAEWMLGGRRRKQRGPSTSTLLTFTRKVPRLAADVVVDFWPPELSGEIKLRNCQRSRASRSSRSAFIREEVQVLFVYPTPALPRRRIHLSAYPTRVWP